MQSLLVGLHARAPMAVVLVTHDVEEALLLADTVCIMAPGRGIVASHDVPGPRPRELPDLSLLKALKAFLMKE